MPWHPLHGVCTVFAWCFAERPFNARQATVPFLGEKHRLRARAHKAELRRVIYPK